MADITSKIPVTVITGFLGSGKTTLLNHIVKQPELKSTALIINEFGEIGIDHLLVETSTEVMVELNNGCICCTIRGDLADKLSSLAMWMDAKKIPTVERVIVETTGLANPAPIVHTLITDQNLLSRFRVGGVLTVVDAIAGPSSLQRFPEATKQIVLADVLVVSKYDLIDSRSDRESYDAFRAQLLAINSRATLHEAAGGTLAPGVIYNLEKMDVERTVTELARWLDAESDRDCDGLRGELGRQHHHAHRHDKRHADITSTVIRLTEPVDGESFNEFLQALAIEVGHCLLRVKGIVHVIGTPDRPALIQGVQHVFFPVSWLDHWPDNDRTSKIVFIIQGLEASIIEDRFRQRYG